MDFKKYVEFLAKHLFNWTVVKSDTKTIGMQMDMVITLEMCNPCKGIKKSVKISFLVFQKEL